MSFPQVKTHPLSRHFYYRKRENQNDPMLHPYSATELTSYEALFFCRATVVMLCPVVAIESAASDVGLLSREPAEMLPVIFWALVT
ncbi:hypothetical protein KCP74_09495 [Salmonella enterica subsp. enterica]|nr:hypothetical protein KCP74_09495 [Salmonella enterica subsp. enterica]